jgi:hypothetical protein
MTRLYSLIQEGRFVDIGYSLYLMRTYFHLFLAVCRIVTPLQLGCF